VSAPVGLFYLWAIAGIAGVLIGFRTIREIVRDVQADRENKRVAELAASRLAAIDEAARLEQEQMESEFSAQIEAWLKARSAFEAGS
jgi:hypothetical protein